LSLIECDHGHSHREAQMRVRDLYPLITCSAPDAARDFWVKHFGATTEFEADWFVLLSFQADEPGARPFSLAFMRTDHPSRPPGPEAFSGEGMLVTVEVADVAAAYRAMAASGAPILYGPADEPWGQRRFMTRDPAGVCIDVVEQIAPKEGYWG
jgi:uncharacterized glyoxalase superfamily protein PhnB